MKIFCGISFAWAAFVFLNTGFARQTDKRSAAEIAGMNWQQYDSLATECVFNRDTIGALKNYRLSLDLNPGNEYVRKNYERLSYFFTKSGRSFYYINP